MQEHNLRAALPHLVYGRAYQAAAFAVIAISGLLPACLSAQSRAAMSTPAPADENTPPPAQNRCVERSAYPGEMWCTGHVGEVVVVLEPGTRTSRGARLWSESPNVKVADDGFVLTP